jgi:aminoglycoside phosphotransferase (APT) family kinase protein
MDLGPTPVQPVHSSVARRVGELLAAVHAVAPKTDRRIEGQWVAADARPTQDKWAALLGRAHAANKPWADELAALSRSIDELSAVTAEASPESVVITNCDIVVDAVRLGAGQELVVMHWDFAGPMVPEWELASTLLQWTAFGRNLEAARALLEGYKARGGDASSLTLGSFTTAITGWLTWTLHRGWEASGPQPPEKEEFAERALREVLGDPLTVGKLEAFLEALEPAGS